MLDDVAKGRRETALAFLLDRVDYERTASVPYGSRTYKLDRMRQLLSNLGDPQGRMPIVHVAGSKGKGSTAAMIAAVLTAARYRTGLYSSPHLERLEERMAVDGGLCTDDELVELVEALRAAVDRMRGNGSPRREPTYFELTTAMSLLHFARRQVDVAVLEVGMGGRLDSTNVCRPLVSVITSISFDHTKQLGNTLAAIAREKAGIVKPGVPVVSGVTEEEPRRVIEQVCRQQGSRLIQAGVDFDHVYHPPDRRAQMDPTGPPAPVGRVDVKGRMASPALADLPGLELGLLGRHQGANAAVAVVAADVLTRQGLDIREAAVRRGIAEVQWPVRVELVAQRPAVVVDAAHNVASLAATIRTLDEHFAPRRRLLVFATTLEKDLQGMLQWALPRFDEVILTRYLGNPRFVPVDELDGLARKLGSTRHRICPDPAAAWKSARDWATVDDLICVTGSFFLAAETRALIRAAPSEIAAAAGGVRLA